MSQWVAVAPPALTQNVDTATGSKRQMLSKIYAAVLASTLLAMNCEASPGADPVQADSPPSRMDTPEITGGVPGARTLLVQSIAPWGYQSNELVLQSLGVPFDTVDQYEFSRVKLENYQTIIIASDQTQSFYDALYFKTLRIYSWLERGARTLEFHGAQGVNRGNWKFPLPLKVRRIDTVNQQAYQNFVVDKASVLVAGVPRVMNGNLSESTVGMTIGKAGRGAVVVVDPMRQPTLMDYCYGLGRVIATGQGVEYGYFHGLDDAPQLVNMITTSTQSPGCQPVR